MDFYILDDDIAVVKTLKHIITDRKIGTVVGYNTDVECAIEDIREERPEIIMVDFMMKEMDGITFIKAVKKFHHEAAFIMISKLSDKSLVNQAYDAGVEFFVSKPVNVLEIERVCQNIIERIKLKKVVDNIQSAFMEVSSEDAVNTVKKEVPAERKQNWLDVMLGSLGILSEKGTNDIRKIYEHMEKSGGGYSKQMLSDVADMQGDSEKNVEQRVRRALKKALTNVAAAKIDMVEDDSQIYAKYVFDHLSIKMEVNYQEGISPAGGRVSIPKFMDGLTVYRDFIED
jgi:response regulator receiver domain protein